MSHPEFWVTGRLKNWFFYIPVQIKPRLVFADESEKLRFFGHILEVDVIDRMKELKPDVPVEFESVYRFDGYFMFFKNTSQK